MLVPLITYQGNGITRIHFLLAGEPIENHCLFCFGGGGRMGSGQIAIMHISAIRNQCSSGSTYILNADTCPTLINKGLASPETDPKLCRMSGEQEAVSKVHLFPLKHRTKRKLASSAPPNHTGDRWKNRWPWIKPIYFYRTSMIPTRLLIVRLSPQNVSPSTDQTCQDPTHAKKKRYGFPGGFPTRHPKRRSCHK